MFMCSALLLLEFRVRFFFYIATGITKGDRDEIIAGFLSTRTENPTKRVFYGFFLSFSFFFLIIDLLVL